MAVLIHDRPISTLHDYFLRKVLLCRLDLIILLWTFQVFIFRAGLHHNERLLLFRLAKSNRDIGLKWVKINLDIWKRQCNVFRVTSNDGDRNIINFESLRATSRQYFVNDAFMYWRWVLVFGHDKI